MTDPRLSRRALLAGGVGGVVLVGAGVAATRPVWWWRHRLGLDGEDGRLPATEPGRVIRGSFNSAARGRRVDYRIALPRGNPADPVPVVLVLHGKGASASSVMSHDYLGADLVLADLVSGGMPGVAVAAVDGGDSYWHPRDSGEDSGAMVMDEFLPLLSEHPRLSTERIGITGWSMGGYGALRLAGLLGPERVPAVGAMSPALWVDYADSAPGAFDDADDLAEHTVMGRQEELARTSVRVDCGEGDPFAEATRVYRSGFASTPAGGLSPGDHDVGYWRRVFPAHLELLARAVTADSGG